eukprot:NODE_239_length_13273_cov_0.404964.p4 type:complete len:381 gc:universal NODE_239_length_13273_cov_0.404964:805-1947(+)
MKILKKLKSYFEEPSDLNEKNNTQDTRITNNIDANVLLINPNAHPKKIEIQKTEKVSDISIYGQTPNINIPKSPKMAAPMSHANHKKPKPFLKDISDRSEKFSIEANTSFNEISENELEVLIPNISVEELDDFSYDSVHGSSTQSTGQSVANSNNKFNFKSHNQPSLEDEDKLKWIPRNVEIDDKFDCSESNSENLNNLIALNCFENFTANNIRRKSEADCDFKFYNHTRERSESLRGSSTAGLTSTFENISTSHIDIISTGIKDIEFLKQLDELDKLRNKSDSDHDSYIDYDVYLEDKIRYFQKRGINLLEKLESCNQSQLDQSNEHSFMNSGIIELEEYVDYDSEHSLFDNPNSVEFEQFIDPDSKLVDSKCQLNINH